MNDDLNKRDKDLREWCKPGQGARALKVFVRYINAGKIPPAHLLRWLCAGFDRILDGVNPATALNLKRIRGRPQKRKEIWADPEAFVRCYKITFIVENIRANGVIINDKWYKGTYEMAVEVAGKLYNLSESTVKRVYREKYFKERYFLLKTDPLKVEKVERGDDGEEWKLLTEGWVISRKDKKDTEYENKDLDF